MIMKKGLILALLMVAVLAITMPAGAVAPVIKPLPTIIIGNANDGTSSETVLRYLDVLDLTEKVNWKNVTYTSDTYQAYWMPADADGIEMGVGNADGFVDALSTGQAAVLDAGTMPPAAANITEGGSFFLSLMNLSATSKAAGLITPHFGDAGVETWGLDFNPSAGSDTGYNFNVADTRNSTMPVTQDTMSSPPTMLTLYAAVTSGSTQIMVSDPKPLEIYSILGDDSAESSYIIELTGAEIAAQWKQVPATPGGSITGAGTFSGSGFTVAIGDNPGAGIIFGTWQFGTDGSAVTFPLGATLADISADEIYAAHFTMHNDSAPTGDLSPGYRITFTNAAYTHYGGVEVNSNDAGNSPSTGGDATVSLFWSVPRDMTAMGETDWLAVPPSAAYTLIGFTDFRQYGFNFDLFHTQLGDYGIFTMEEVLVEIISKPSGGTANPFTALDAWDDTSFGFIVDSPYADGDFTFASTSITIETGDDTTRDYRYVGAEPANYVPGQSIGSIGDRPTVPTDELCLFSATARSVSSTENTPMIRLYLKANRADFDDSAQPLKERNVVWFTIYGSLFDSAKQSGWNVRTAAGGTPLIENPGVPELSSDSVLECYAQTGIGLYAAGDVLNPQFSVLSLNLYGPANTTFTNDWLDDSGGITISNVDITTGLSY
jgi:hypothetical protein